MNSLAIYPGCSLEGTARDYMYSINRAFELLNIEVKELEGWICCGASSAHSIDENASIELPAYNLHLAEVQKTDIIVPCALCFNRLKTADKKIRSDPSLQSLYNYHGGIKIWDIVEFFSQKSILDKIRQLLVKPLDTIKPVCYYGCVANRPPGITDSKRYEDPVNMDQIVEILGAKVIDWPFKTECCGASLALSRPDLVQILVKRLYDRALDHGADCIVVSCQMCQANLDMQQEKISSLYDHRYYIPVIYFTELINIALGDQKQKSWLKKHFVDPTPLLTEAGLFGRVRTSITTASTA